MWSFGETVPRERVDRVNAGLMAADAVLVVGSSLMVYSGYRFVAAAARNGMPIAAINLGRTRADALLTLKVEQPCALALDALCPPAASQRPVLSGLYKPLSCKVFSVVTELSIGLSTDSGDNS